MPKTYRCGTIVTFTELGYGRQCLCPNCGARVVPETPYQKTAVCQAHVCRRCGKTQFPFNECRCGK